MLVRAERDDAAFIVACQKEMAKETENMQLDTATIERGVAAVFADTTLGQYWLWRQQDHAMGCLLTIDEWSDWRCGKVAWIHSVFVLPDCRGQKVFSKMYRGLQQQLIDDGPYLGLRLYVDKTNHRASAVYRALGMDGEHYGLYEWFAKDKLPMALPVEQRTLLQMIEQALPHCQRLAVRSAVGLSELRGDDLKAKASERFVTVYHGSADHSEHRSHVHINLSRFKQCLLAHTERGTPFLAFIGQGEPAENALLKIFLNRAWEGPQAVQLITE